MNAILKFYPPIENQPVPAADLPVAITPEVASMLAANCVVAIGVSGGKDSDACAIAVSEYLDKIGHAGKRVLVHADLGVVEWKDSLPSCERLANKLGWELLVVRRIAGDMMDRWETRWRNNMTRYADLSCVKTILPWSTPSMRFCTSELKSAVITSALKKRYKGEEILNVTGIRRQESSSRQKAAIAAPNAGLSRKGLRGFTWNAIIEWPIEQVFSTIKRRGLALHEAYTKYKASRVSCCFCIMSSNADLSAAASCPDNHDIYRRMVELEATSTFAFQGGKWLADVAPHLLSDELRAKVEEAKVKALQREKIEARIPKHLLYTKGWPTALPSAEEAELIAEVRRDVAAMLGLTISCTTGEEVIARYQDLMNDKMEDNAESEEAAEMM